MKKSKDLIRKYDSEDISPQWISKACSVTLTYTRLYLYIAQACATALHLPDNPTFKCMLWVLAHTDTGTSS